MESYYRILGAKPGDTHEVLRRRYRERARLVHPDLNRLPEAEVAMRRLNQAWEVLGDPARRGAYDEQLQQAALRRIQTRARNPGGGGTGAGPGRARNPGGGTGAGPGRAGNPGGGTGAGPGRAGNPGVGGTGEGAAADQRPRNTAASGSDRERTPVDNIGVSWTWSLFRPSLLIPLVLLVIFVGTAYAGHVQPTNFQPSVSPTRPLSPTSTTSTAPADPLSLMGRCVATGPGAIAAVPCWEANDGQVTAEVALSERCPAGTTAAVIPGADVAACLTRT